MYIWSSSMEKQGIVEKPLTRARVREIQRRLKLQRGWSARRMAEFLQCSRSYLKKIESGTRKPSPKFTEQFHVLEEDYRVWAREFGKPSSDEIVIVTGITLPKRFELNIRPVRCDRCRRLFIPRVPIQKRHNPRREACGFAEWQERKRRKKR